MMRLIYDSAKAVEDYQKSPDWMHKLLDAFADGVNFYLYKHPDVKPLALKRFEPWYALMFTDGSVSATSTGGLRVEEIKNFYSGNMNRVSKVSDIEKMILKDRGMKAPGDGGGMEGMAGSKPAAGMGGCRMMRRAAATDLRWRGSGRLRGIPNCISIRMSLSISGWKYSWSVMKG